MVISEDMRVLQENLAHLRRESLAIVTLIGGVIAYIWLLLDIWPVTGKSAPASSWLGASVLMGSAVTSYRLRKKYPLFSVHLLAWSILLVTTCAVLTDYSAPVVYLFVLPVIFADTLLNRRSMMAIASFAIAITLLLTLSHMPVPRVSSEVLSPILIIVAVTLTSLLTARNLHTTLAWFGNAYESSYRNEQLAREQAAELRRLLTALDDLSFRLERTNYTLMLERNQAEEARRLKQQFAQNISHELRTPLNLIVAFTELMAQSPEYYGEQLPPGYMRDLSIVYRNAHHLQQLVNDVLDLARVESAQMTIIPEETDPGALLHEAVNTMRSLVEMRGLVLKVEVNPLLPHLWIDPTRIRQVLFNLLNNAVRFTEIGSITTRVCCRNEEVVFSVTDTGVGISPEDMPRLFKEFEQLDGSTKRRHGGAGLGLAISKRFVELHGGRIWVESRLGQGSTFFFALPIIHRDLVPDPENPHWDAYETHLSQIDQPRILLAVTRSPAAATLLLRHVSGCRTVAVQELLQARLAAQRLLPQGIVIDTAHEPLTCEGLQALAEEWGLSQTSFIACPLPGEDLLSQQLAVDAYLIKPVSIQNVRDVLHQIKQDVDRILIIDDDQDFVRLLHRMLDRPVSRYQVVHAYSGQEGLLLLKQHKPDLVFLDLQLPDMDGLNLVTRIRANGNNPSIVIISAQDQIEDNETIRQPIMVTKAKGAAPGELVQLIQHVLLARSLLNERG